MKRFIFSTCSLALALTMLPAQTKVGIFVPGYSLDPNAAWLNSGTPQRLVNEGVLNSYVVLPGAQFTDVSSMSSPYGNEAASVPAGQSQRWMVIGHSIGGLLARVAEWPPLLSLYNQANVQLKGIATIGTPHQGLPLARSYVEAPAILDAFSADVLAGPAWERANNGFIDWLLMQLYGGVPLYERLASSLNQARENITQAVQTVSQLPLIQQLQPGSTLMNALQSIPPTVPHLSIAGVEQSPAVIRWAFSTDVIAGEATMLESDAASNFQSAKDVYNAAADFHRFWRDYWEYTSWLVPTCYWSYCYEEERSDKEQVARDAWGRGWWALNDIDNKWFQLHNEYLIAEETFTYWATCDVNRDGLNAAPGSDFIMVPDDPCARGEDGYWETVIYRYSYADRSDALVPLNRTTWFAGESFAHPNTPASALRQGNISFDGGYNNSEMRYLERPESGQPSQPMQYGRSWIAYWIGFQQ